MSQLTNPDILKNPCFAFIVDSPPTIVGTKMNTNSSCALSSLVMVRPVETLHEHDRESETALDYATFDRESLSVSATAACPFSSAFRQFGRLIRSGLTASQCDLLAALADELTQGHRSSRPDGAEVIRAREIGTPEPFLSPCPYLIPGIEYVMFCGNETADCQWQHGYGYSLDVWMQKASYDMKERYSLFLEDLAGLTKPFDLVTAGLSLKNYQWTTLEDLRSLAETAKGERSLRTHILRVYTPADYPMRWREYSTDRKALLGDQNSCRELGQFRILPVS